MSDYIICAQCNLHKKAEANTDLALYVNYLLKGYHISSDNVVGGMLPFNKNFTYKKRENDFIMQNSNKNEVLAAESSSSASCRLGQASRPMLSSPLKASLESLPSIGRKLSEMSLRLSGSQSHLARFDVTAPVAPAALG